MIANFTIIPYKSAGPIFFGMSRTQLHAKLGSPSRSKKSKFGNRITDYWPDEDISVISSSEDGAVEEVSFGAVQLNAEIEGLKIFEAAGADSYRALCLKDGCPQGDVGFTVLFRLGLALDGFLDTDQEERVVTVFARGVWDENDKNLKPIHVS